MNRTASITAAAQTIAHALLAQRYLDACRDQECDPAGYELQAGDMDYVAAALPGDDEAALEVQQAVREIIRDAAAAVSPVAGMFGRINDDGNVAVLMVEDGYAVTRLDVPGIYPVGSSMGVAYEHPEGIVLSFADALRIGLPIER